MGDVSDYLIRIGLFKEAENTATNALSIDNKKKWIKINLAAALLFQGKYSEAENIYLQYKGEFKKEMLDDLETFSSNGIIPKEREADVEKIKIMLNE